MARPMIDPRQTHLALLFQKKLNKNGKKMIPEKIRSTMKTRSQENRCSKKGEKIIVP
jgi:hypothetical protein